MCIFSLSAAVIVVLSWGWFWKRQKNKYLLSSIPAYILSHMGSWYSRNITVSGIVFRLGESNSFSFWSQDFYPGIKIFFFIYIPVESYILRPSFIFTKIFLFLFISVTLMKSAFLVRKQQSTKIRTVPFLVSLRCLVDLHKELGRL